MTEGGPATFGASLGDGLCGTWEAGLRSIRATAPRPDGKPDPGKPSLGCPLLEDDRSPLSTPTEPWPWRPSWKPSSMALTPWRPNPRRAAGHRTGWELLLEGRGSWRGNPHLFISWRGHITPCA